MKVYNGEGMILGRLAARVAKDALLGEEVKIINCEKIIVSGKKSNVFAWEKQKISRGGYPLKCQKYSRLPDRFVRRSIRGMLPWRDARGREVFKKIMCYIGVPKELSDKKLITLTDSSVKKLPNLKYVTMGEICAQLGGKISRR